MKQLSKAVVSAVTGLVYLSSFGCGRADTSPTDRPAVEYDGKALFSGIMLGSGAAAEEVPELWSPELRTRMHEELAKLSSDQLATRTREAAQALREDGMASEADRLDSIAAKLADKSIEVPVAKQAAKVRSEVLASLLARIEQQDPGYFARFQAEIQSGDRPRVERAMDDAAKQILKNAVTVGGRVEPDQGGTFWVTSDIVVTDQIAIAVVAVAVVVGFVVVAVTAKTADGDWNSLRHAEIVDAVAGRFACVDCRH